MVGSRAGGFYGPGWRGALIACDDSARGHPELSLLAPAQLPGRLGGMALPCPPGEEAETDAVSRPASDFCVQRGFWVTNSPFHSFSHPQSTPPPPPPAKGDTLKPHPLRAVTAKGRVSGRWRPAWLGPDLLLGVHMWSGSP